MLGLDTELKQTRFYQEVFAEGRIEGRVEGEARGEARLLRKLLMRRFGSLPDWVELRLTETEPAQLETWGERVLEAQSLEDVFATES